MTVQEVQGPIHEVGGAVPALDFVLRRPDPVGSGEVWMRIRAFVGAGMFIKTIGWERGGVGHVAATAHVPLAEVASGIPGGFESARQRRSTGVQEIRLFAGVVALACLQETGDAPAGGMHSGEQPRAGRRADGRSRVVLREADAFPRHAIKVGRGNQVAAITTQIAAAHVVGEEDDDVGAGDGWGGGLHDAGAWQVSTGHGGQYHQTWQKKNPGAHLLPD